MNTAGLPPKTLTGHPGTPKDDPNQAQLASVFINFFNCRAKDARRIPNTLPELNPGIPPPHRRIPNKKGHPCNTNELLKLLIEPTRKHPFLKRTELKKHHNNYITPEHALKLEKLLPTTAEILLAAQEDHILWKLGQKPEHKPNTTTIHARWFTPPAPDSPAPPPPEQKPWHLTKSGRPYAPCELLRTLIPPYYIKTIKKHTSLTYTQIHKLKNGRTLLSPETAMELEKVLPTTAEILLNAQDDFLLWKVQQRMSGNPEPEAISSYDFHNLKKIQDSRQKEKQNSLELKTTRKTANRKLAGTLAKILQYTGNLPA